LQGTEKLLSIKNSYKDGVEAARERDVHTDQYRKEIPLGEGSQLTSVVWVTHRQVVDSLFLLLEK
jgi:hypothetical protein